MQTPCRKNPRPQGNHIAWKQAFWNLSHDASKSRVTSTLLAMLLVCMMVMSTTACSWNAPFALRLAGRDEGEDTLSPCEIALQSATHNDAVSTASLPSMMRKFSAARSQQAWLDVAQYCTGRFAEGALSSALAGYRYSVLNGSVADSSLPSSIIAMNMLNESELDARGLNASTLSATPSSAIALAEDRSAFALEIIASHNGNDSTLLSLSDNQKAVAQTFVSLHPKAKDPRQKIYSIENLRAHPQTIVDASTGLLSSTSGAILMTCARDEIAAMNTISSSPTDEHTQNSASGSSSNLPNENQRMLRLMAELVALRAYQAFTQGYPAFESAIFTS